MEGIDEIPVIGRSIWEVLEGTEQIWEFRRVDEEGVSGGGGYKMVDMKCNT
jgi:hypothetical protein